LLRVKSLVRQKAGTKVQLFLEKQKQSCKNSTNFKRFYAMFFFTIILWELWLFTYMDL